MNSKVLDYRDEKYSVVVSGRVVKSAAAGRIKALEEEETKSMDELNDILKDLDEMKLTTLFVAVHTDAEDVNVDAQLTRVMIDYIVKCRHDRKLLTQIGTNLADDFAVALSQSEMDFLGL